MVKNSPSVRFSLFPSHKLDDLTCSIVLVSQLLEFRPSFSAHYINTLVDIYEFNAPSPHPPFFSSFQWHTKTLDSIHSSIYSVQFISRETWYILLQCLIAPRLLPCLSYCCCWCVCVCDRTTSSNSESSISCILISSSFLLLLLLLYCRARRILINTWTEFPHLVCLSVSNTVGLS